MEKQYILKIAYWRLRGPRKAKVGSINFLELQELIAQKFSQKIASCCSIDYKDSEGELISLESQEEWQTCLQYQEQCHTSKGVCKIYLILNEDPNEVLSFSVTSSLLASQSESFCSVSSFSNPASVRNEINLSSITIGSQGRSFKEGNSTFSNPPHLQLTPANSCQFTSQSRISVSNSNIDGEMSIFEETDCHFLKSMSAQQEKKETINQDQEEFASGLSGKRIITVEKRPESEIIGICEEEDEEEESRSYLRKKQQKKLEEEKERSREIAEKQFKISAISQGETEAETITILKFIRAEIRKVDQKIDTIDAETEEPVPQETAQRRRRWHNYILDFLVASGQATWKGVKFSANVVGKLYMDAQNWIINKFRGKNSSKKSRISSILRQLKDFLCSCIDIFFPGVASPAESLEPVLDVASIPQETPEYLLAREANFTL